MTVFFLPFLSETLKDTFVLSSTSQLRPKPVSYTPTLIIYIPTFEFPQETQGIFALQSQEFF